MKNHAVVIIVILLLAFVIAITTIRLVMDDDIPEPVSEPSYESIEPDESVVLIERVSYQPQEHSYGEYVYNELVLEYLFAEPDVPPRTAWWTDDEFVPYCAYLKYGKRYRMPMDAEWQLVVWEYSQDYGVPYEVALAISGVETSFDVYRGYVKAKRSDVVYYGCGMVSTVSKDKISAAIGQSMCTPEGGIAAMCYVFGKKLKEFDGNITYALMAYNMGSGGARRAISEGRTSTKYAEKVIHISQGFLTEVEDGDHH